MTAAHLRGPAVTVETRRGCTTKIGYATRREAVADLEAGKKRGAGMKPYKCRHCGNWHATSGGKSWPGLNQK